MNLNHNYAVYEYLRQKAKIFITSYKKAPLKLVRFLVG